MSYRRCQLSLLPLLTALFFVSMLSAQQQEQKSGTTELAQAGTTTASVAIAIVVGYLVENSGMVMDLVVQVGQP